MRRTIVLGAVVLAVAAAFIGQRLMSDQESPEPADMSRPYSAELDERGKAQAEQMELALEETKRLILKTANPHELVVTIRDELPLDVWDSSCHLDASPVAPVLGVFEGRHVPILEAKLPADATPMSGGGCEAAMTVRVRDVAVYTVGVVFEGNGIADGTEPKAPLIKHRGTSQKVTIVE